jgi:uncharacterized damage-inducible protein DinB
MTSAELLVDAFGRIREVVHETISGLSVDELTFRPSAEANSIGWLVWHLTRIQDDHIADAADLTQVWDSGWADRFGLPFDRHATGYAQSATDVAAVRAPTDRLAGYHDAVYDQTIAFVSKLSDADLPRIVDERWNPPVSLGVRLISVISDDLQHAGQAAYVRGLL